MNSLTKLIALISALIASLSFAWIALTLTGNIPHQHVTVELATSEGLEMSGDLQLSGDLELSSGSGVFYMMHNGSVEVTR
jgi:hypothetical protein